MNNHTFRGEYDDANELFKALCSTMLDRPSICSTFSITEDEDDAPYGYNTVLTNSEDSEIEYDYEEQ